MAVELDSWREKESASKTCAKAALQTCACPKKRSDDRLPRYRDCVVRGGEKGPIAKAQNHPGRVGVDQFQNAGKGRPATNGEALGLGTKGKKEGVTITRPGGIGGWRHQEQGRGRTDWTVKYG